MRRVRLPVGAHVVVMAILLAALPVFAVLQYRWLGEVSDAERERLQASWRTGADRVAQDVDRELSRAFLHFQRHASITRDGVEHPYQSRLRDWQTVSPYPRLVARAWTLRPSADRSNIDPIVETFTVDGTLVSAGWPSLLNPWRDLIRAELAQTDSGPALVPSRLPLILEPIPAVIISLNEVAVREGALTPPRFIGLTVLQLDTDYLSRELLPGLVSRHFGLDANTRVAVVHGRDGRLLFTSDAAITAASMASPDITSPILRIRFTDFGELLHGVGGTSGEAPRPVRNLAVSVFRREVGPTEPGTRTTSERLFIRSGTDDGQWRLVVKHRAGSLEAAVAGGRRRNLAASFGVLLVLAAAVGALTISSRRAQRLARQQMDFVAGVSHELRTPLAVIRSAGENLADGVVDDPVQMRRYGALIATEGRRLTEMVDQVLEFSGGPGRRASEPQPVDVRRLIDEVVGTWSALAAQEGFAFAVEAAPTLPRVLGDAAALQRAVGNLVSNAMKYSGDGREIDVRAAASTSGPPEVVVSVADRGPGIPSADLAHVFEPFYRGRDAVARQIHGNGLGLSLVRATMDAHGGRVEIENRPGGGTVARLILPAQPVTP